MDLMTFLRMQNLFGQQMRNPSSLPRFDDQGGSMKMNMLGGASFLPQNPVQVPDTTEPVYQPKHEASDKFHDMLEHPPVREQYHGLNRVLRTIGSVAYGFNKDNPAIAADQAMHPKYFKEMGDYTRRLPYYEKAADNERGDNTNERIFQHDIEVGKIADRKQTETERTNVEKERIAQEKVDTANKRADTAAKRAEVYASLSQGGMIQFDKNNNAFLLTKTGELKPIEQDLLSPAELAEIKAKATGEQRLKEIAAQSSNEQKNIAARGAQARATKSTPTANSTKDTLADQTKRAKQLISQNPELAGFVQFDKDGKTFIKVKPSAVYAISHGMDAHETAHKQVSDFIVGGGKVETPADKKQLKPVSDDEKIIVEDKDGKRYKLPKSQLADAIKQGYKEVK